MSVTRRPPMSPLSAALTLAVWTQAHGREPRCTECVGQDGLHWYPTYYDTFALSTWSAILVEARTLTSGWTSAVLLAAPVPLKRCLNHPACPAQIPDEGPAVRLCVACQRAAAQAGAFVEPVVSRQRWRRWGIQDIEGDTWECDIDWIGNGK